MARHCQRNGADEILLHAPAMPLRDLAAATQRIADAVTIPVLVVADCDQPAILAEVLEAGATRVVIQAAAVGDPDYISELSRAFGSTAVTVLVDVRRDGEHRRVVGGPDAAPTQWDAVTWARVVEAQGAGELIVTAGAEEARGPFDLELLDALASAIRTPILASAPHVTEEDVFDALMLGSADGVILRSRDGPDAPSPRSVKTYLSERGLPVRHDRDLYG